MSDNNIVGIDKLRTNTIYTAIGSGVPSAGIDGELGALALKSDLGNIDLSSIPKNIAGFITCDTINYVYIVDHSSNLVNTTNTIPYVSLTIPNSASLLYVSGITDRTSGTFNVILSGIPETTGYVINWNLLAGTSYSIVNNTSAAFLIDAINTETGNRILSDTNLQNQIISETSNRQGGDLALQGQIDTINIDLYNLDVDLRSVSGYLQDQIDLLTLTDITQNNEIDALQNTVNILAAISGSSNISGAASIAYVSDASANALVQANAFTTTVSSNLITYINSSSFSSSASVQNTFELHKKLEREITGIIVPLYVYPTSSGGDIAAYNNLINAKKNHHEVPLYVILDSGMSVVEQPLVYDANYANAIKRLRGADAKILGYVPTIYTAKPLDDVKTLVKGWKDLYNIDGIMFDQMTSSTSAGYFDYYSNLTNYIHSLNMYPAVGNPGTTPVSGYFENNCADIFIVYEEAGYSGEFGLQHGWGNVDFMLYPYTSRAHLFHTTTFDANSIALAKKYSGLVYATSGIMPNPWDTLSPYIDQLFQTVSIQGSGASFSIPDIYPYNVNNHNSIQSGDNRTLAPVDVSISTPGFQFLFGSVNANNTTPYADIITCSTWYDGTGGGINQIALSKADGSMYHKFGTFGASGWDWTRLIWDDGNDGSGSGLDADLLDGQHGSYFTDLINHKTSNSNYVSYSILPGDVRTVSPSSFGGLGHYFYFTALNNDSSNPWADAITLNSYSDGSGGAVNTLLFDKFSTNLYHRQGVYGEANFGALIKIWDDANDGNGSGLDADLLDGQHGSYFTNYSISASANAVAQARTTSDAMSANALTQSNIITYSASANAMVQARTTSAAMSANALTQSNIITYSASANAMVQARTTSAAMSANALAQATNSVVGGSTYWTSINKNQPVSTQTVYVSASQNRTYVGCNVTGGPIMVVLPNSAYIMQEVLVKHEGGNITNNNVTVSGGLYNIDDFPVHILDQDYSGFIYVYVNSQWRTF